MGAGSQRLACLSRMMTFAGYAFSVLTVVINLADVTTDIVVAVQFHEDGDTTWFWLVVSSLIIAHIVYLVMAVEILPEQDAWEWTGRFPRAVRIIAWLPFAQLTPLFNLIGQLIHAYRNSRGTENGIQLLDEPESDAKDADGIQADGMQHVVREELDDIGASKLINSRMQKAIEQHLERYGLFYVESAVEAAPQAIIQLLAITFLGRASPAQLVSLCCSLFSITSKAFVISQAYDARVMAFKFALAAHDVFSTFYLFSTLVAQETTKDTDFFGLEVSWLGYIWLWKIVVYAGLSVFTALLVLVSVIISAKLNDELRRSLIKELSLAGGACILGVGPGLLAAEACKLSWYTLLTTIYVDGQQTDTKYSLISSFINGGADVVENVQRVWHMLFCAVNHRGWLLSPDRYGHGAHIKYIDHYLRGKPALIPGWLGGPPYDEASLRKKKMPTFSTLSHIAEVYVSPSKRLNRAWRIADTNVRPVTEHLSYAERLAFARELTEKGHWHKDAELSTVSRYEHSTGYLEYDHPHMYVKPLRDYLLETSEAVADGNGALDMSRIGLMTYKSYSVAYDDFPANDGPGVWWPILKAAYRNERKGKPAMLYAGGLGIVMFFGQLISLAYPFVNAARDFGKQNILQATCFYATCVALFVALCLAVFAHRAYVFDRCMKPLFDSSRIELDDVMAWMADYYRPPQASLLQDVVPVEVLPAEVTAMCCTFLSDDDFGAALGALTRAECAAMRRRVAARGGIRVVGDAARAAIDVARDDGGNGPGDDDDDDDGAVAASTIRSPLDIAEESRRLTESVIDDLVRDFEISRGGRYQRQDDLDER